MKKCSFCYKEIRDEAIICKHCGKVLKKEASGYIANEGTNITKDYSEETVYYKNVFGEIDAQNGRFIPKWNWAAFFFGAFWYFFKGLRMKGAIMVGTSIIFCGVPAIFFWIYSGFAGNYDYYLLKVKGTQFWK